MALKGGIGPRAPRIIPDGRIFGDRRGIVGGGWISSQTLAKIYAGENRWSEPDFSVGSTLDRRDNPLPEGTGISSVFTDPDFIPPRNLPPENTRESTTPNEEWILPPTTTVQPYPHIPTLGSPSDPAPSTLQFPTITQRNRPMSLDLGSIIQTWITAKYSSPQIGREIKTIFANDPYGYGVAGNPINPNDPNYNPALGIPFVDVIPENSTGKKVWDPRANCGQGKWISRQKRRRRRLATASDIKDLAALNGVTTGPQKTTWIATHPS